MPGIVIHALLSRSLPAVVPGNSDPGLHSRVLLPPPPSPLRYVPSFFYRENNASISSLVDSRRAHHHAALYCRMENLKIMNYHIYLVAQCSSNVTYFTASALDHISWFGSSFGFSSSALPRPAPLPVYWCSFFRPFENGRKITYRSTPETIFFL